MSPNVVLLVMHSVLRWAVLATGLVVLVRAVLGARHRRAWSAIDTSVLRAFVGLFDVQLLLGFFLYFGTSALGLRMLTHSGTAALKTSLLRFFAVEHLVGMIAAAILLHVGVARARRLGDDPARQKRTALVVGLAFVIVVASIPWPFFPYGRPLFRFE